ncbi:hypothetical protein IEQ34_008475 [Dendrobium chrysotoxum]|uniref:Uncharacterized protein n=1 Tax=Dendrobium chrysotoxum TaxID=161865 RepID=A0AAV7GXV9_DENCH|nr:hypothetical protein IEQ34_008475 [Dendrobium chrysotoxum]
MEEKLKETECKIVEFSAVEDITRGVEAFIYVSSKQVEILRKLAQDCCKYGEEYQASGVMVMGAPLGNARRLTHYYKKISHDVEGQIAEVLKRQLRSKEVANSAECC